MHRRQESTALLAPQKALAEEARRKNDEARRALTARCGARAELTLTLTLTLTLALIPNP